MQIISIWNNFTWSAKINTRRVLITQRPNRKIYMHMHKLIWWYFWAGGVGGFPLLAHHYLRCWLSCVMCGEESYNVRIARARRDNKHLLLRVARLPRRAAACCCCASPPPHPYIQRDAGRVCVCCVHLCMCERACVCCCYHCFCCTALCDDMYAFVWCWKRMYYYCWWCFARWLIRLKWELA